MKNFWNMWGWKYIEITPSPSDDEEEHLTVEELYEAFRGRFLNEIEEMRDTGFFRHPENVE